MDGALEFEDGKLVVYKRTKHFYARIRIAPRKYLWKSLRTTDEKQARRAAQKLFYQLEDRSEQGLPVRTKTFGAVIDDYIKYREKDHQQGKTQAGMLRQIKRVSKFWKEFAGKKFIESIDDKVLRDFIPWRKDYYAKFKVLPKNAKLHPAAFDRSSP